MDLKDLKIGNYVMVENEEVKVVAIDAKEENAVIEILFADGEIERGTESDLNTKPIKLAEVPLKDYCGFDDDGYCKLPLDKYVFYFKIQNGHIILCGEDKKPLVHFWEIIYLHQLQNLYFSLKGEQMVVNLKARKPS
ncbi:MAG: hypothetical protein ACTHJ0_16005 [Flavipsychrobacter sp.]